MSDAISAREISKTPARDAGGAPVRAEAARRARDFTIDSAPPTHPAENRSQSNPADPRRAAPLTEAIEAFLDVDPSIEDQLGASRFALALTEAATLLRQLSAADAGADAGARADFAAAAAELDTHLQARAAFRADAAKLIKT